MKLACGCVAVLVYDKSVVARVGVDLLPIDKADVVKTRACTCCGAGPGKKCEGGDARAVPVETDTKGEPKKNRCHDGFAYMEACAARALPPLVLAA